MGGAVGPHQRKGGGRATVCLWSRSMKEENIRSAFLLESKKRLPSHHAHENRDEITQESVRCGRQTMAVWPPDHGASVASQSRIQTCDLSLHAASLSS